MMAKKILIIEDEMMVAKSLALDLESEGHEIIGLASTVDKAITVIEKQRPDIVISDINLRRDKDGFDAAKFINGFDDSIHIIFLTGYGQEFDKKKLKQIKYFRIMEKPILVHEILAIVNSIETT